MELSQEEKERIIAEEKLRFETKTQLMGEKWGKHHGPGWGQDWMGPGCPRGGFFKGLLAGILLAVLFCFLFHHHHHGYGGWRHGGGWGYGHGFQGSHFGHGFGGPGPQDSNPDGNQSK
jgi:hypothetical protein